MSKTSVAKGIKLNSFNDLFGANASDDEIIDIPLGELYAFCKHPFSNCRKYGSYISCCYCFKKNAIPSASGIGGRKKKKRLS